MMTLAIFHSVIRKEEKLIINAAKEKKIKVKLVDIRAEVFNPETYTIDYDIALERSVSTVKGAYATAFLESLGMTVVNSLKVAQNCENKFMTSLILAKADIPIVRFAMAFDLPQALQAVEELGGFPVVLKPSLGSWGRLLAKINDRDSLEAILEHKNILGTPPHKAFYLQEYVRKPGRDIRAFCIDGEVICAVYRKSSHWITNTARGAITVNCPVADELRSLCRKASDAVGGMLLAIDVFETDNGFKINEINHTMEFRNSEEPTGVRISSLIVDYCSSLWNRK
jgi:[lysine-biosynthesis-protein LysW]--L-2-aminoadipate ligase